MIHAYDPRAGKWAEEAPMLTSRIGAAVAVI